METLIIQKIDGLELVAGLGRAVIDPVKARGLLQREIVKTAEHKLYLKIQSRHQNLIKGLADQVHKKRLTLQGAKITTSIKKSPEYKAFEKVQAEVDPKSEAGTKAIAEAWQKYKIREKELIKENGNVNAELFKTKEYLAWTKAREEGNQEMRKAFQDVGKKKNQILEASPDIYFMPKAGESIIDEEEAELMKARLAGLPAKTFLSVEGEQIADRRGEKYWYQDEQGLWKAGVVEKLGETITEEAVPIAELTREMQIEIAEQAESTRRGNLSEQELQKEFLERSKQFRRAGALMRSELELDEVNPGTALKEAQTWYKEQVAELKIKYDQKEQ